MRYTTSTLLYQKNWISLNPTTPRRVTSSKAIVVTLVSSNTSKAQAHSRPHPRLPRTIGSQPIPSQDDVVTYAINGLSDKYGCLAQIIAHKEPFPDLSTVRSMVSTEEMRIRNKSHSLSVSTNSSAPQVMYIHDSSRSAGDLIWQPSNNLLSWSSKRQFTLSRSSAEAEYRGVSNAVAETCWLRNLLRELHTPLSTATIIYCDNVSVVYLSSNPVQHQRTKHIEIDIHFVRDLVTTGHIRVLHVPSRYQYADIFTKGLPTALFDEFRDRLSVRSSPAQTAGELLEGSLHGTKAIFFFVLCAVGHF
ncbi:ribonuclease H-like domain-containing protein [Tanacetum coccineum]|uniref:Ribonuclease H-like domain-containing protein n=1 Tax=Tanacetum coccineum TaxID=301880 RepID=A0ABQ5GEC2_9ASTR